LGVMGWLLGRLRPWAPYEEYVAWLPVDGWCGWDVKDGAGA